MKTPLLLTLVVASVAVPSAAPAPAPLSACSVDGHMHLNTSVPGATSSSAPYDAAAKAGIAVLDEAGIRKSLLLPPPADADMRAVSDWSELARIAKAYPERYGFLAGGGTLNRMIYEAVRAGSVSAELRRAFEQEALKIARSGAAGFGELAALHLSFAADHPFEAAPPDHQLFLLLADIAARVNLPIDLHMEAVVADKPFTNVFPTQRNPETLTANIAAFERLLRHNRKARIVWAHAGWDNTGDMTVALLRRLLKTHPNLSLGLKLPPSLHPENSPMAADGSLRPEWLKLLREFPTRVVVGADEFLTPPGATKQFPRSAVKTWQFVARWPAYLAKQVACENAKRVYRLSR